jgi:hypothetical protein
VNFGDRSVDFDGVNKHRLHYPAALPSDDRAAFEHSAVQTALRVPVPIDWALIAVIALVAAAVAVWLSGSDFALDTHFDEPTKVQAVLTEIGTYGHPILMIQLVRAANAFFGLTDPQSVVELGRAFAAVAGGLLCIATFVLARLILPAAASLAVVAATLATPLISVHARYFKEDIFVAPFLVLALTALIVVLRTPTRTRLITLGITIGLAGGSKYVGGVILLPYALAVMVAFGRRERTAGRLADAGIVALTAAGVFGLIEIPAFLTGDQFLSALRFETFHALNGHRDVVLPITLTWGVFHLRESLWPGLGPLLTVLGVFGLSAPFVASPERRGPLAVIAGLAVVWYLAHEISPLKPYPDFARYMVPLAPLLIILAAASVFEWTERFRAGAGATAAVGALLIATVPAGWRSLSINVGSYNDPRALLPYIVKIVPGRVAVDRYAGFQSAPILAVIQTPPTAADTTIVVTSSFDYDRYQKYGALPQQSAQTRAGAQFYADLLVLPRLDVSNGRPSFGYFNPTTTIIALDGDAKRLLPIAKLIETTAPTLAVRWNGPQPAVP